MRMGHRHVAIARRFALKCGGDGRRRPTTATTAPLLRRRPNVVVYTRRQLTFKPPIVHSFRKFQPMLLSIRFASSVSFFYVIIYHYFFFVIAIYIFKFRNFWPILFVVENSLESIRQRRPVLTEFSNGRPRLRFSTELEPEFSKPIRQWLFKLDAV